MNNIEYIIKSKNEIDGNYDGYWHNEDGWCDYPDEATIFSSVEKETFNLPVGNDVSWVVLADEQVVIENYSKGDFILRLVPHVDRKCTLTYCCPECGDPTELDITITREMLESVIDDDEPTEFVCCCDECDKEQQYYPLFSISDVTHIELHEEAMSEALAEFECNECELMWAVSSKTVNDEPPRYCPACKSEDITEA